MILFDSMNCRSCCDDLRHHVGAKFEATALNRALLCAAVLVGCGARPSARPAETPDASLAGASTESAEPARASSAEANSAGRRLPTAQNVLRLRETAFEIVITPTALRVREAELADIRDLETPETTQIPALAEMLRTEQRADPAPPVVYRVDARVLWGALANVLYTAARAGFYEPDLVVSDSEGADARVAIQFEPAGPGEYPVEKLFLRIRGSGYDLRWVTYEGQFPIGPVGPIVPVPIPSGDAIESLRAALRAARRRAPNEHYVLLVPDRGVTYATIVATMDLLISEGFAGVALADGAPFWRSNGRLPPSSSDLGPRRRTKPPRRQDAAASRSRLCSRTVAAPLGSAAA